MVMWLLANLNRATCQSLRSLVFTRLPSSIVRGSGAHIGLHNRAVPLAVQKAPALERGLRMSMAISNNRNASSATGEPQITDIKASDFEEWARLFRAYIAFYKSSLPEEQYRKTFDRLIDPKCDLYGLVMRNAEDASKLVALAHFFPHQTPWSEKQNMLLNDLFVDPNIRGKGLGRKLISAVAEEATAKGCYRLKWVTQHENPARKLYDQLAACEFVEYRMKLGEM